MPAANRLATPPTSGEIVLTRVFDAPRRLVFEAWCEPRHLLRWFAPEGCTTPHCTVDFRPGGRFHFCMRLGDGREIWGLGVYREIVAPERIVYVDTFADAQGNVVPPTHYGMSAGHPAESVVTVTFAERDGRTTLELRQTVPEVFPERDGTTQGWSQMLERLAETLAAVQGGA